MCRGIVRGFCAAQFSACVRRAGHLPASPAPRLFALPLHGRRLQRFLRVGRGLRAGTSVRGDDGSWFDHGPLRAEEERAILFGPKRL